MCPVCTKFPMGTCLPAHFGLDCKVFHKWMWGCPCHRLHSLDGCCRSWALQRWNVKPGVDQRYLNWSLPGWLSSNANLVFPLVLSASPEESRETCGSFCIFCKECHLPPGECHKEFQHFSRTLWSKSPNRFGVQAPCMAHIALSQDGTACDWCANLHASVAKRTVSTCNCLRIDTSGEAVGHKKKLWALVLNDEWRAPIPNFRFSCKTMLTVLGWGTWRFQHLFWMFNFYRNVTKS